MSASRIDRRLRAAFAIVAVLAASALLGACGADDDSSCSGSKAVSVDPAIPASGCGSVPTPMPKDPDGVLAALPKASQDEYEAVPGAVTKSVWADFKPDHPPPYKVGLAFAQLNVPAQVNLYEGIKKSLEADPDIEFTGLTTGDAINVPQQQQQFSSLLAEDPDLLIVEPLTDAFSALVDKAGKRGIPTISIQGTTSSKYAVNMEPNNNFLGIQGASVAVRQIEEKGNLLYVHGIASTATDQLAVKGVKDTLKNCPNVKMVGEIAGAFVAATAKAETLRYLATNPEPIHAVLNTGAMANGIISAFEQTGRPIPVVVDRGGTKGGLGYWINNEDSYSGFAQGVSSAGFGKSVASVAQRMLAGRGLQIAAIAGKYTPVTPDNLSDWANPSWNLNTPGLSDGPPPTPETYMSEEFLSTLFKDPAPPGGQGAE